MAKLLEFLTGKKTYIIAVGIAVATLLPAFGVIVPEYVWGILAALGLGAIRAGIKKAE